jgi:pentatricopeptide repeat protein
MREKGVTANVITYNASISACEKGGKWQQALALLDQMR